MKSTTRVLTALALVVVVWAQLLGGSSVVGQDGAQGPRASNSCLDHCPKKDAPVDVVLSLLGYLLSASVIAFPWVRANKENNEDNIGSDRLFMAFLAIGTLDYAAWIGYSLKGCHYCNATVYMIMTSIIGCIFSFLLALLGLVRDHGYVTADKWEAVSVMAATGGPTAAHLLWSVLWWHKCFDRLYTALSAPACYFLGRGVKRPSVHSTSRLTSAEIVLSFKCYGWRDPHHGVLLVVCPVYAYFTRTETVLTTGTGLVFSAYVGWLRKVGNRSVTLYNMDKDRYSTVLHCCGCGTSCTIVSFCWRICGSIQTLNLDQDRSQAAKKAPA